MPILRLSSRSMTYLQLCAISAMIVGFAIAEICPSPTEMYVKRGTDLLCRKYINCEPGNEILPCKKSCEPERCSPCPEGMVQPYLIHSRDPEDQRRCFTPQSTCRDKENIPTRYMADPVCSQEKAYCKCDEYNCFYGNPCICSKKIPECPEGEYLLVQDKNSAECVPCPLGTHKPEKGCQPCRLLESPWQNTTAAISATETTTTTASTAGVANTTNTLTTTPQPTTTRKHEITTGEQLTSTPTSKGDSSAVLIITLTLGFLLVLMVAMVICCIIARSRRDRRCLNKCLEAHYCCRSGYGPAFPIDEGDTDNSDTDTKYMPDNVIQVEPQTPIKETEYPLPYHPGEMPDKYPDQVSHDTDSCDDQMPTLKQGPLTVQSYTPADGLGEMHPCSSPMGSDLSSQYDKPPPEIRHLESGLTSSDSDMTSHRAQENEEDTERKNPAEISSIDESGYKSTNLDVPSTKDQFIDIKHDGISKEIKVNNMTEMGSPSERAKLLAGATDNDDDVGQEDGKNEEETQLKVLYKKGDSMRDTSK